MLAPLLSECPSVPAINIEYCSEHIPSKEPASPFDTITFVVNDDVQNTHRSQHLLPPPVLSPRERVVKQQQRRPTNSSGLDPVRFEMLRAAARAPIGASKPDLRKEVAVRAHHSKQLERRNLFLSKIEALPSPTATSLPVTPPESPAVFHFTLPSPGLVSPLALFESLDGFVESRPVRVEQVDFRARAKREAEALAALTGNMKQSLQVHGLSTMAPHHSIKDEAKNSQNQSLPSLDQISKRLGGNVTVNRPSTGSSRLPAFLQRSNASGRQSPDTVVAPRAVVPLATAALVFPSKANFALTPTGSHGPIARPTSSTGSKSTRLPVSPASVTLLGPHIASTKAPMPLTAAALNALADRAERGSVMMERLKRRFSAPAELGRQKPAPATRKLPGGF